MYPKAIRHLAIDLSAPYVSGVRDNFGNARIVYDRIHLSQNLMEECDQVRKAESRADGGKRILLDWIQCVYLKKPAQ